MSESKRSNAKDTKAADKKSTAAEKAPVIDLGFLEEDDDFDEFPAEGSIIFIFKLNSVRFLFCFIRLERKS